MTKLIPFILLLFLLFLFLMPVQAAVKENDWKNGSIYYLVTDRFRDGDSSNDLKDVNKKNPTAYQGGDFQGIIAQLDSIKDMGFTAILLAPIFDNEAGGFHGHWTLNFYKPDEHFGTMAEFQELVREAHKRKIHILLEFDAIHVGSHHSWLTDPLKKDWFKGKETSQLQDDKWTNGLPVLNESNAAVRRYMENCAKWWIKKTGIDGYRLDNVNEAPISFWKDFTKSVKSVKNDVLLLGESEFQNRVQLSLYQKEAGFDGVLNTPLVQPLRKSFSKPDVSLKPAFQSWNADKGVFKNPASLGSYFDNGELSRFTRDMIKNKQFPVTRWELALTYLYTQPETPIIYYGTEIALNGGNSPDNQRMMNFRADQDLIDFIKQVSGIRNKYPALKKGSMKVLYQNGGAGVFKRQYRNETIVTAINNTSKTQTMILSTSKIEKNKELHGLLNGDMVRTSNGEYKLVLDRETSEIYLVTHKTGVNYVFFAVLGGIWLAFLLFLWFSRKHRRKAS